MRRVTWVLSLFVAVLALSACSDDGTAAGANNGDGWEFNDAGDDASGSNNGAANNGAANNGAANNGAANNGTANNGTATDGGTLDVGSASDAGTVTDAGTGPCEINSDCASGEVCCPSDFQGNRECRLEADCQLGGYCEDQVDCTGNQVCCDLSSLGSDDMCLQENRCMSGGGGGNMGDPCTTNADCTTDGEVCCPSLSGTTTCEPESDCFTGGVCENEMDCSGNQECCDLSFTKQCFDQCNF